MITQEEDAFVLEDEPPIQGATPSESNDKLAGAITVKQVELREVPEDVKSDEDFDIKMAEIRVKVDTVQNAADAFRSHSRKSSTETRSSGRLWLRLRQNITKDRD